MTTYAENLIVLSVTKIYSPVVILFAAGIAIILGFLTKFGAVVNSIPPGKLSPFSSFVQPLPSDRIHSHIIYFIGVFGGITFTLYSIITITGIRIWMDNKVDFSGKKRMGA
jgi:xanthine/uracil permease